MNRFWLIIFILFPLKCFSQSDTIDYSQYIFTNLSEAVNKPDKVINLNLAGRKLKKFPPEILAFVNIRYLDLGYTCNPSVPHSRFEACPGMKTNKIREIPDEIINLKSLKFLKISYNRIPCRKVEKLIGMLPNCEISNTCFSVYDN